MVVERWQFLFFLHTSYFSPRCFSQWLMPPAHVFFKHLCFKHLMSHQYKNSILSHWKSFFSLVIHINLSIKTEENGRSYVRVMVRHQVCTSSILYFEVLLRNGKQTEKDKHTKTNKQKNPTALSNLSRSLLTRRHFTLYIDDRARIFSWHYKRGQYICYTFGKLTENVRIVC